MITREQSIQFKANSAYVRNSSHMTLNEAKAYNRGYMDGAHEADESLLNTFKLWLNHSLKYGKFLLDERGYQDEEEMLKSFKGYLGL